MMGMMFQVMAMMFSMAFMMLFRGLLSINLFFYLIFFKSNMV